MQTTENQVLATMNAHRQALIMELRSYDNVLLGAGHLVVSHAGMPLEVGTERREDGKLYTTTVGIARYGHWHLFTKEDAEAIAANTYDGAGNPAKAQHIRTYLTEALAEVEACIDTILKG